MLTCSTSETVLHRLHARLQVVVLWYSYDNPYMGKTRDLMQWWIQTVLDILQ